MRLISALCVLTLAAAPLQAQVEEPIGLHVLQWEAHRDTPTSPDLLGSGDEPILPLQPRALRNNLCATVFGYLPYWESSTYLRWDLLSHIACFSVEVNADGSIGNTHGWPWTALVNTAHANGVKVILVATNFNSSSLLTLVSTPAYKNNFFVNIRNQILLGGADGVNIDFEGTGTWRNYINGFMAELTAYLHSEIPGCEVTFAGPAVNYGGWDLPGLAASCDGIFIMGYAFWGSWSSTSGPNAPLTGGTYNITNTVLTQYGTVTQNNPEKLILGLPYYGHHWTTTSSDARASVIDFIGSTRFKNDEPNSATYGLLWDSVSQTPWYRWNDGSTWHQVWFDNAESLGLKYQLAQDYQLQGVGMWALGYDGARTELWDELEQRFANCEPALGDVNRDGTIDLEDYKVLGICMGVSGPGQTLSPEHMCLANYSPDLDGDLDVDLADYQIFMRVLAGEPATCLISDFEGYANGTEVVFIHPRYSGSTSAHLAATPDVNEVTDEVTPHGGLKAYKLQWQFVDTAAERWLRATTHNATNVPSPTIWLDRPVRVRLRLDSGSLRVSLGIRETGTTADIGQYGGTSGPIEWVGASSKIGTSTPVGKLITANPGVWQTVVFDPATDPILAFTGDGVLSSATNKGTLEHLAFTTTGGVGPFTVYIDDIEQLCY